MTKTDKVIAVDLYKDIRQGQRVNVPTEKKGTAFLAMRGDGSGERKQPSEMDAKDSYRGGLTRINPNQRG
jgi:hypothetical protein